jgi:hypothetical protein
MLASSVPRSCSATVSRSATAATAASSRLRRAARFTLGRGDPSFPAAMCRQ